MIIKSQKSLSQSLKIFYVDNSYPASTFKGCNIVDLDFVYKRLLHRCKACKTTLSLTQCQRERLIGLASILYLSCQNCSTVMMVRTSTWHLSEYTQDAYAEMHPFTMLILSGQQIRIRSSCYNITCESG